MFPSCLLLLVGAGAARLAINLGRVVVGQQERLIFTAHLPSTAPAGTMVALYQAAGPAASGTQVFPLVDTGDYSARDAFAGDGVYSNTMSAMPCTSPGDLYFYAMVSLPAGGQRLDAVVHCVNPPAPAALTAGLTKASEVDRQLHELVATGGKSTPEALAVMAASLKGTAVVDAASVRSTGQSVVWQTTDGLTMRAHLPLPGQRAAPGGDSGGGSDPQLPNKPYKDHQPEYAADYMDMLGVPAQRAAPAAAGAALPAGPGTA